MAAPTTNGGGMYGHEASAQGPPPQGSSQTTSGDAASVSKDEVGWYFVQQYYTNLNSQPDRLYLFYNKKSSQVWGTEGEQQTLNQGQAEIQENFKSLEFKDCKVRISNVDSQASIQGGIVIMVLGEMSNDAQEAKKFAQTFFLAPQQNGYFVLNDIFRYLKDDDEEEDLAEETEPVVEAIAITEEEVGDAVVVHATEVSVDEVTDTVAEVTIKDTTVTVDEEAIEVEESEVTIPVPADENEQSTDSAVESALNGVNGTGSAVSADDSWETDAPAQATETPVTKLEEPATSAAPSVRSEAVNTLPPSQGATTPVSAPAPVKAAPAVPKTWASMFKGPTTAAATVAPAVTPVIPKAAEPKAKPETAATNEPTTSAAAPASPGGWQNVSNDSARRQARPASVSTPGVVNAYIKFVNDKVEDKALKDALQKHGPLRNFEVRRDKTCAFAEFYKAEDFASAKAANPYVFDGHEVIVEERRPRPNAPGSFNRGGSMRGGPRGDMGGRGSFRGTGDRFNSNNRGSSERGGRGSFTPRGRGTAPTS